ncbi:hypothetical protein B0H19DRAFT_1258815 [Mycena capillaripes]|nr:hypothetical protein B0H19DRAFT_1258815 [Mycena capillaripes]
MSDGEHLLHLPNWPTDCVLGGQQSSNVHATTSVVTPSDYGGSQRSVCACSPKRHAADAAHPAPPSSRPRIAPLPPTDYVPSARAAHLRAVRPPRTGAAHPVHLHTAPLRPVHAPRRCAPLHPANWAFLRPYSTPPSKQLLCSRYAMESDDTDNFQGAAVPAKHGVSWDDPGLELAMDPYPRAGWEALEENKKKLAEEAALAGQ